MDTTLVTGSVGTDKVFGGASFEEAAAEEAEASNSSAGMISSDFETFLTMLTAQLENQDPLNPVESTDYAVQLATFSGVEQQVQTNTLLTDLKEAITAMSSANQSGIMGLSDWVGMNVVTQSSVYFTGNPITIAPKPDANAAYSGIEVRNSDGEVVHLSYPEIDGGPIEWTGLNADGSTIPSGVYTFHAVHYDAMGNGSEAQVDVLGEVVEARLEGGEVVLVLDSGATMNAADAETVSTGG